MIAAPASLIPTFAKGRRMWATRHLGWKTKSRPLSRLARDRVFGLPVVYCEGSVRVFGGVRASQDIRVSASVDSELWHALPYGFPAVLRLPA
jgi:hypothetical protein